MTKTERTQHPVFAACQKTAPLKDLQFCLRNAEQRLQEFALSDRTIQIMGEMARMERDLDGVIGTSALQKKVWALVDRYRGSIDGWARRGFPTPYRRDGRRRWVGHRTAAPQRITRLSLEGVRVLVQPATLETVAAAVVTRKVPAKKAPALACPQCQGALVAVAAGFACAGCADTWQLTRVVEHPQPRVAKPRLVRTDASTSRTACSKCGASKPTEEFGSRTDCRDCRRAYREQRKAAA